MTRFPPWIARLRDEQLLLVLDNCEHVIDAAANLAVVVVNGESGVTILATSRELLRVHAARTYSGTSRQAVQSPTPVSRRNSDGGRCRMSVVNRVH